jgi:CheY-like chemotaxis protein
MFNVLVVDDEEDIRNLANTILQHAGYSVTLAGNGEEAIRIALRTRPDIILMDVVMPGKTGFDTCRILKSNPSTRDIAVVIFSALGREVDKSMAADAGADGYLIKPFTAEKLLNIVEEKSVSMVEDFRNALGKFSLIKNESVEKKRELSWLKLVVKRDKISEIKTIVVSTYDMLSQADLRSVGISEEDVYLVRLLVAGKSSSFTFKEHVTELRDDLEDVGVLIKDVLATIKETGICCDIVIYTLSNMIHTHGWRRVYSFIISIMPEIRGNNIALKCFYYPESHASSEINIFEKLADEVVTL